MKTRLLEVALLAILGCQCSFAALSGYPSNWANNGTSGADLPGNGTMNTLVVTNGATALGVTVANLPANAAGKIIYCSDCLTPWGTGALVFNDGTNWRLVNSGVIATTSSETYLISVLKSGKVTGDGQYDFGWIDRYSGAASSTVGTYLLRIATASGTGASISAAGVNVTGSAGALTMTSGTTVAPGTAGWKTADFYLVNQGYDLCIETVFNLSALSTATDEYWLLFSLTGNATVGSAADANVIGLLYDRAATWGAGGTIANWKILTKKVGVGQTITESSTAVATGVHSLRVYVTPAGTTAHFYIDGTQVGGDVTSNLPASLSSLRMAFEQQNTAHAGVSISANQIVNAYAGRRTSALFQ